MKYTVIPEQKGLELAQEEVGEGYWCLLEHEIETADQRNVFSFN